MKPGIIIGETFRRSLCLRVEKGGPYFFEVLKVLGIKVGGGCKKETHRRGAANENGALASFGCSKTPLLQSKNPKKCSQKNPPSYLLC